MTESDAVPTTSADLRDRLDTLRSEACARLEAQVRDVDPRVADHPHWVSGATGWLAFQLEALADLLVADATRNEDLTGVLRPWAMQTICAMYQRECEHRVEQVLADTAACRGAALRRTVTTALEREREHQYAREHSAANRVMHADQRHLYQVWDDTPLMDRPEVRRFFDR